MAGKDHHRFRESLQFRSHWILFVLVLAVVGLSILAFNSPVSQNPQNTTLSPTSRSTSEPGTATAEAVLTLTPEGTTLPPTPEEIGYTNGIILWSTILILILLAGTLRAALYRKGE